MWLGWEDGGGGFGVANMKHVFTTVSWFFFSFLFSVFFFFFF